MRTRAEEQYLIQENMRKYLPSPHKFRPKNLDSTDSVDFTHFKHTVNRLAYIKTQMVTLYFTFLLFFMPVYLYHKTIVKVIGLMIILTLYYIRFARAIETLNVIVVFSVK